MKFRWPAAGLALVLCAPSALLAQEIRAVTPQHALAGTETRFTAEGIDLPTQNSPKAGLKLSTLPAGACENARRTQPATPQRYHFACTFAARSEPVVVRIHQLVRGRSELLWAAKLPVLAGPPKLTHITLSGSQPGSQSRVRCDSGAPCVTLTGDLAASSSLSVEVRGQNLPPELHIDIEACNPLLPAASASAQPVLPHTLPQDLRQSQCTLAATAAGAPARRVRILSAAPAQGGQLLWQTRLGADLPPATSAAN